MVIFMLFLGLLPCIFSLELSMFYLLREVPGVHLAEWCYSRDAIFFYYYVYLVRSHNELVAITE